MDTLLVVCFTVLSVTAVQGHAVAGCQMKPCTANYDPICGSDGQTYGNKCSFDVAMSCSSTDLKIAHMGECTKEKHREFVDDCPIICTMDYNPVCGSDGKTYGNNCGLKSSNCRNKKDVKVVHKGEC